MNSSQHPKSFRPPPAVAIGLILFVALFVLNSRAADPDTAPFRAGFSHTLFTEVNQNDAEASVKAWVETVAKERNIPTDPPLIFQSTTELVQALQKKEVAAVGISTIEYAAVIQEVRIAPIFVTYSTGQYLEQYLVLVRHDSHLDHLSDLRGRKLAFHFNARNCMAQLWLDTQLVKEGGKPTVEWLGEITQFPKLSQVVLPVFFHQRDACVVTRAEFETMCELNPQLGQQLKIIARSPEMVTAIFCFRADYAPTFKEKLLAGLRDLNKTAAGQQVLTIFQSDKIEEQPAACLDSALELLAQHAQLAASAGSTNSANALPQGGAPQTAGGGKL